MNALIHDICVFGARVVRAGKRFIVSRSFLRELIPDIANWEIYLLGTDINRLAINDAKNGCYSEWAFRMTNPFIKQKYFTKIDRGYQINSDIKKMVDFHYHNLMHDDYPSQETETVGLDLILCRNVFIYFDPTVAMQIGERFKECLVLGGALLLGPSDFFTKNPIDLIHKRYGEIGYFEKKTTKETVQKVATGKLAVKRKILSVLRARPADAPKRSIVAPNKVTIAAGQKPEDILAQLDMLILDERWSEVLEAVSKLLEKNQIMPCYGDIKQKV